MKLEEIVREYLIKNGFDGLFNNEDDCACELEDLFPCAGGYYEIKECEPGYKQPGNDEFDFFICSKKEKQEEP